MASSSGTKKNMGGAPPTRLPTRGLTKTPSMAAALDVVDNLRVPPPLESAIAPILRVASEVEEHNPRVAYLCRFHAWKKADQMDPRRIGRGVLQFQKELEHKYQKEEKETKRQLANNDRMEIVKYYQNFYEKNILEGQYTKGRKEMIKMIETTSVLYDVLMTVVPSSEVDEKMKRYAEDVEEKREQYEPYNILPLRAVGLKPGIMEFSEIKAAIRALHNVDKLPILAMPQEQLKPPKDILEWLSLSFGFQKGNVANQREHLILLLANMDMRSNNLDHYNLLDSTVKQLEEKMFANYRLWCDHLPCESNLKYPQGHHTQQLKLLYIGLYLLIWGEASNIRFMPECLCFIFHRMADELYGILFSNVQHVSGGLYKTAVNGKEAFLQQVVTPIYKVLQEEAKKATRNGKKASHSAWRNYDDINEYFWSDKCFELGCPLDVKVDSSVKQDERNQFLAGKPKTNFVEVRTFWHIYRSFDRMWIFFVLALQVMIIIAWHYNGSPAVIFDEDVFKSIWSIFITAAILNFLRAFLDIIFSWNAWRSLKFNQILRYIMKLLVAAFWVIVMPITYCASIQNPKGVWKIFSNLEGDWRNQSVYYYCVAIYLIPNILALFLFLFPSLLRSLESSNQHLITLLMWWAQPKLYIGRGMHEDVISLMKYTLFWIMLLISKLAFSFYIELLPLVQPTKIIMNMPVSNYEWHEFFPHGTKNFGVLVAIWAPIILVYFMDTQIWYAIFSTIIGGIYGAFSHLGEIRTLRMLRSRFESIAIAFNKHLVPYPTGATKQGHQNDLLGNIAQFSKVWNAFISSMREEDLINDRERDMLCMLDSSREDSIIQWPLFLLASKVPIAVEIAKDCEGKTDDYLKKKIRSHDYMLAAVNECYETLKDIMFKLMKSEGDKTIVKDICDLVDSHIQQGRFLATFSMSGLASLSDKLGAFLELLVTNNQKEKWHRSDIEYEFQHIMDIITHDLMKNGYETLQKHHLVEIKGDRIDISITCQESWRKKVDRLRFLFIEKESAINVPMNLDARRRMAFFANSMYMTVPSAPEVRSMLSFSVLTPFYKEEVIYSDKELKEENEDGISILFYLQKIYPDEWKNFEQRMENLNIKNGSKEKIEQIRMWVSYRAQTLSRTVRGMMYYRKALEVQSLLDSAGEDTFDGYHEALADLKFNYVISCQVYGAQKRSKELRDRNCYKDILNLMTMYPSLRVAYIDEKEEIVQGKSEKVYYSVLVKAEDEFDEEIYRIKLPGSPIIGEGKPENQNHAIIFTRGEALQTIDMNQDNYLEEAFKMRNVLEEFLKIRHRLRPPTILGLREHVFTGSVSSLAWIMSNQETSFVTIGQRTLANPLRVRFHYGHPDIFDRIFHLTRGGISKASKTINLSEDIFSGYNSTLRGGYITHHEYIQVGKGRDVGMNQISAFEAKVANGNGEQTLSRDVYRLGHRFDFFRMLSFYFTTVGFYFSSMVTVLIAYIFLYGLMYLVLSGLETEILEYPTTRQTKALEQAIATESIFQLGVLLVLPMVMEIGLEKGFRAALGHLITLHLQLAPVFFTFQLGTKAHYYGRSILHGGSKYRATGRGFVVKHAKFAENYRMYSRSHFVKGLELFMLLIVYEVYGHPRSSQVYFFVTWSMWFLVVSWLFAPFLFNPSGFEWQKTVDDWTDWVKWMGNRGGIKLAQEKSWESWWDAEQAHLKDTSITGRVLEIILAFRFFIYQYGIVYHLDVANGSRSLMVYGLSWFVMISALLVLKVVSIGRRKFGVDFQLMFRILKALLFLGFVSVLTVLFVVCGLTIYDLFAAILAFMPTGWAFLVIAQACRGWLKGTWDSVMELARVYEAIMGIVIFMPVAILAWFPFVSEFQTRLLFNQAFSRGLQISMILAGKKSE